MIHDKTASKLTDFANDLLETIQAFNPNSPDGIIHKAYIHNKWFTHSNVIFALNSWANTLKSDKTKQWLEKYQSTDKPKNIILILAGNIPAVGFHDVLCTLLSGHNAKIKASSDDKVLMEFLLEKMENHLPEIKHRYSFEQELIKDFDAVIATGSNNSQRYFKKYFSKVPHIIRHNRNSLAILDGSETQEDLKALREDIFRYFGLGCRNVSLLLIPKDYDWKAFLDVINENQNVLNHNAYANNLTYYTAYFSLMDETLINGGTVLLRKHDSPASPPAVLHFHHYKNQEELDFMIKEMKDALQCVVRKNPKENEIAFGQTQTPNIDDYADGVNTMEFLSMI